MTITSRNFEKKIKICLGRQELQPFMIALLNEWEYTVNTGLPENSEEIVLADDGCTGCRSHHKKIRLTSSLYADSDQVKLPISIEELWRVLEKNYHRPPRHYLRLTVDYPITMTIRGKEQPGRLSSISPAGARLSLPRELAVGETFPVILPVLKHLLHLKAKVIYINTFPDKDHHYDAGILFDHISPEDKALLRDAIILTFITDIRQRLSARAFTEGILYFDLSETVRAAL